MGKNKKIIREYQSRIVHHARGKKSLLNDEQLALLIERLKIRPRDGGIWTGPKVARWIEKGVEKHR